MNEQHDQSLEGLGHLSSIDSAALDALVEAAFEAARVPDAQRERAESALRLLRMLDVRVGQVEDARERLVQAVLKRVGEARDSVPAPVATADDLVALSHADDDALEALVSSGFDPRRVAGGMRERASQHMRLLSLLSEPASASSDDSMSFQRESLIQRTMARVANQPAALRLRLDPAEGRGGSGGRRRFRFADLVSVAAVLLIGTAVVLPIMGAMRARGQQVACMNNMAGIGGAFSSYAVNNKSSLPLASASVQGTPWWFVGDPQRSNSANLYQLRREKYTEAKALACVGNRFAQCDLPDDARDWPDVASVSYSYQNMFTRERPSFDNAAPAMVVLVDRSPVILKAIRGEWFDPTANSPNHGGRGQTMLRLDGSAVWTATPVTDSGDNVWLPRDLEQAIDEARRHQGASEAKPLKGTEAPASADDAFVAP